MLAEVQTAVVSVIAWDAIFADAASPASTIFSPFTDPSQRSPKTNKHILAKNISSRRFAKRSKIIPNTNKFVVSGKGLPENQR